MTAATVICPNCEEDTTRDAALELTRDEYAIEPRQSVPSLRGGFALIYWPRAARHASGRQQWPAMTNQLRDLSPARSRRRLPQSRLVWRVPDSRFEAYSAGNANSNASRWSFSAAFNDLMS